MNVITKKRSPVLLCNPSKPVDKTKEKCECPRASKDITPEKKKSFIRIEHLDNRRAAKRGRGKKGVLDKYDIVRITYDVGGNERVVETSVKAFVSAKYKEFGSPKKRLGLLKGRVLISKECGAPKSDFQLLLQVLQMTSRPSFILFDNLKRLSNLMQNSEQDCTVTPHVIARSGCPIDRSLKIYVDMLEKEYAIMNGVEGAHVMIMGSPGAGKSSLDILAP